MASGGPPPAFGFRPPPPPNGPSGQQQQQQFRPPPPPGQAPSYDSDNDDGGALTSTINLVTSAANMFFKPPPPPANNNNNGPPPPSQGPPAPIETTTSMLDTPAPAFQAPPPAITPQPQPNTPQAKMTIGGSAQMIPPIPSLPSQPATPTQFPPPRSAAPAASSSLGFTPPVPQQQAAPSPRVVTDSPKNVFSALPPASPAAPAFPPPMSPAANVFQAPAVSPAAAAFPPPAGKPAANVFQAPPPASPAAPAFPPPAGQPPMSPAANVFEAPSLASPAAPANVFQAPPPTPASPVAAAANNTQQLPSPTGNTFRGAVNAVAAANKLMSIGGQPSPKPTSPSKLKGAVNAAAVANNFMKLAAKAKEQKKDGEQVSPNPSPQQKMRGAVNAALVANKFMKMAAKEPEPEETKAPSEQVQQLRGAVTAVIASNMLKGEDAEQEPASGKQLLKGAVTTVMASNTLAGSSKPPMQKFTPPPSPKVHAFSTRSPRTPLIANTSPMATPSGATSTGSRTPIRKLNLPTPSKRTTPTSHRKLRLPPARSSSGSGSAVTKTTPRAKFRLPPSRKKKVAPEPTVNLKPKVEEAPPAAIEMSAATTTAPPPTTMRETTETPVESTPAEPHQPPTTTAAEEEPKEPEVSEPPKAVEDALPEGWIETTDPHSGKVYYYNADTQETSWEKPKVEEPASEVVEETATEPEPTDEPPTLANDALPAGWIETTDPTSGKMYYYNADTQETSWEKPKVETPPATDNTIEVLSQLKAKSTGATDLMASASVEEEKEEEPVAAEEWSEVTDPNSGKVYYYNTVTQETSWDRPAAMDQPPKESAPKAEEVQETKDTEDSIFEELNAEFGYTDPSETNEEEETTPAAEDVPEEKDALPDGWTEVLDEASGNKYYYNPTTQETSWELPALESAEKTKATKLDVAPSTDTTIEVLSAMSQQPEEATSEDPSPEESNDLPADWEEVVDPNSGDIYYFNSETNETSWERPTAETSSEDIADEEPVKSEELDAGETSEPAVEETSDLPADWEEVVDPNSGDVYYFNSVTNETSWERPSAELIGDETDKEPATAVELQPEESSPAVEETPQEASDLPADWEEVVDPNSGDVYYFNSVTNETSWERPGSEEVDESEKEVEPAASEEILEEESTPTSEEMQVETSDLPADWEEVADPNSGDIYYFNSVTNETSWERPGSKEANEAEEETEPPASEEVEESTPAMEEPAEESSDLPDGWEEVVDPNSGDVYYFNSATNETSWERPSSDSAVDAEDEVKPAASEEIQEEEPSPAVEEPAEKSNDLPDDWEEVVDPNSGDVYYFNSATNETSWERPGSEDVNEPNEEVEPSASEESALSEAIETEGSSPHVAETMEETNDLPADWDEVADPNSGEVYYFNSVTNETSWERPGSQEATETELQPVATSENTREEEPSPPVEQPPEELSDLPSDWEEVVDPNTGDVYYFNSVTNETSWERPSAEPANDDTDKEPTTLEKSQTEEAVPDAEETQKEASDLPPDWEEVADPNTGDIYYFNSVTNETSWDRPGAEPTAALEEISEEEASPAVEETQEETSDLPADWEEVADPNTGDVYYFNAVTNETSWERPVSEQANEAEEETEVAPSEEIQAEESTPAVEEPAKESSDLPDGWEEVVDPNSGDVYYFNSATNETSWERPSSDSAVDAEDEVKPAASEEIQEEEPSPAVEEPDEAAVSAASSDLPENWTEVVDESTGQAYFYNSLTQETSWERPVKEEAVVEEDEMHEDAAPEDNVESSDNTGADSELPADWIEATDESSGQKYYYNTVSQETSWEKPSVPENESVGVGQEHIESEEHQEDGMVDDNAPPKADASLPPNWIETEDESGQLYYYNTVTSETSWERPPNEDSEDDGAEDGEPEVAESNAAKDDESDNAVHEIPAEDHDDLPADWIEAVDETSGQTYYYNTATQETSWEKPSMVTDDQEEDVAGTGEAEDHVADDIVGDDSAPGKETDLPRDWIESVDESTGQTYYYNTVSQETSWEKPSTSPLEEESEAGEEKIEVIADAADEVAVTSEPANDATESTDITDADGSRVVLPECWTSAVDETTGETYYYNSLTQETSWELPEGSKKLEVEVEPSEEADVDESVPADDDDDESLPENWSKEADETTGEVYYYNNVTHESSWEKPGKEADSNSDADERGSETGHSEQEETEHSESGTDSHSSDDVDDQEIEEHQDGDNGPIEWTEAVDESSGQTYYYNTVTGETSWEKPAELAEADDEVDEADNDIGDAAPTNVNDEKEVEESSNLPANWIEAVDETSGQTYYYNTETQETSWERPIETAQEVENEITSESNTPSAETNDEVHDEDGNAPSSEENESQGKPEEHDGPTSEWAEVLDEATGQVYYYNSVTEETSWEKPYALSGNTTADGDETEIIPPVDSATDDVSVNGQELETEAADAVESGDLPDDWIESVDENSGKTYYYNTVTQETSWEKPSSVSHDDTPVIGDVVENEAATNDEPPEEEVDAEGEGDEAHEESGDLPSEWIETVDESSGQTYYYNTVTQETSWEKPSIAAQNEELADETDENDEAVDHTDPVEDNMETENDFLPSDWIETVDDTSGQTYYYNTVTQETSWEKPSETAAGEAMDEDDGIQDAVMDENVGSTDQPAAESKEAEPMEPEDELPSEWVETVDESTGQVYYFNTTTQETSWEKPSMVSTEKDEPVVEEEPEEVVDEMITEDVDEPADAEPVVENEETADDTLPNGWIKAVDEASGQMYYYNTETQETSWEKPTSNEDEAAGDEDNDSMAKKEPMSECGSGYDTIAADKTDAAIGNSLDVSQDSLPGGWVEVVDEDSGNVYYYNSETSETSWEKPTMRSSEPNSAAPKEMDQNDNGEDTPSEEWEVVDEPNDDGVLVNDTKDADVDIGTHIANICDERQGFGILGPLSLSEDEAVLSYIKSKFENTRSPLWGLIDIAARSRGRLRSEDGVADRSSPESLIVELLLREESGNTPAIAPSKQLSSTTPGEEDEDLRLERVQSLLLRGNRVEAVKEAVECKDFATALLVASMCDPETYKYAAKAYAENVFAGGSPMYTIGMLFSGSMQVPSESSSGSFWGIGADELNGTWKKHLAAVISNRTASWDRVVLSLGDRLREIGSIEGAHFCYMVCGCRFTVPLDASTRVSLLGCDHADTSIISLTTNAALDSFNRTEAYEWAKRMGNKNATIKSFQPFKVIFATSLVDHGFEEQATLFALGIRHCVDVASAQAIDFVGEQWSQVFEDSKALGGAFRALEERLDLAPDDDEDDAEYEKVEDEGPATFEEDVPIAMNPNDSYAEEDRDAINSTMNLTDNDATFVTAASNLMDKPGYIVTPQRETPPEPTPASENLATKATPLTEPASMGPPGGMSTIAPPSAQVPKSNAQAMPPRMPPTPTMRNSASNKEEVSTPMAAAPPAAAPMAAMTPKETIKQPEKAPSTAPSVMMGKKSEPKSTKKAPSSTEKPRSGGLLSGFRSRMIKVFNPDAVECELPDSEEKAYYDEKLKRWVFPGDDLDELAKPMAPPPIIPGGDSKPAAAEPEPKPDTSNDPLAAMMAPPPRRPGALGRRPGGTPGMPPVGGAMPPMPGMPPMMPGMPSPAAGGAAAPPQFAVFTPSKKEEEPKKDEE